MSKVSPKAPYFNSLRDNSDKLNTAYYHVISNYPRLPREVTRMIFYNTVKRMNINYRSWIDLLFG